MSSRDVVCNRVGQIWDMFGCNMKLYFADNQNRVLRHDMIKGLDKVHQLMVATEVTLSIWM